MGGLEPNRPPPGYAAGVIKASAQLTKGGPCRNFAYYSMLIILSWQPKGGGPWPNAPPKYALDAQESGLVNIIGQNLIFHQKSPYKKVVNFQSLL